MRPSPRWFAASSRAPRRATVHVAWGPEFLREAEASAATAVSLGIPRLLVTDAATARACAPIAHFDRVLPHEFRLCGQARKTEMLDLLPPEFDSFLFLDTDTAVLMDVGQAFERSERHGIALAQASQYSLEHFWGFGTHLRDRGFRSDGLLQYNTGVIFFTRTPRAWRVMRAWRDLCAAADPGALDAWGDQPYLTLAMELAGFNPYTLSIAYNYRNFGEPLSGDLRIWHSRLPPPADVNVYAEPWPPRRFNAGVRLES